MRDLLARLRAALTPQAVLLLAALLLCGAVFAQGKEDVSALEQRAAKVLSSVSGAGRVEVVIMTRGSDGNVRRDGQGEETPIGAIAVAQGADDPIVCMSLQQALCALLSLPASSVSVVTGGK